MLQEVNLAVDPNFRKFAEITKRVERVVVRIFSPIRSDAQESVPSFLVCDKEKLSKLINESVTTTRREGRELWYLAAYQPVVHAVFLSNENIQAQLKKGKSGERRLAVIMAEELIHAQTTVAYPGSTRTGFISFPFERASFGESGKLYHCDLDELEIDPTIPKKPVIRDISLTENATRFAIHFMLDKILPDLSRPYPFLSLCSEAEPILIPKKPHVYVCEAVLKALYSGNRSSLRRLFEGNLLKLLEDPSLKIASCANQRPSLKEILTFDNRSLSNK